MSGFLFLFLAFCFSNETVHRIPAKWDCAGFSGEPMFSLKFSAMVLLFWAHSRPLLVVLEFTTTQSLQALNSE